MTSERKLPAIQSHISPMPGPQEWSQLKEQAVIAVRSKLIPSGIDTPEKAMIIVLKGREIGIPPMQAFSHIHVINGKPSFSAELMLALIFKNCPGATITYLESSTEVCKIEAKRPGGKPSIFSFSMEDAAKAQVLGKGPWKQYPAAMLRARCISAMARAMFPDATMGCSYTPEELGAEVNEEGQVLSLPPENHEQKKSKLAQQIDETEASFKNPKEPDPSSRFSQGLAAFDEAATRELGITPESAAEYIKDLGNKNRGKKIKQISRKDLIQDVEYHDQQVYRGTTIGSDLRDYILNVKAFLMKDDPLSKIPL